MPKKRWQARVLTTVKQFPGLTARQVQARLEVSDAYYRAVGDELVELEKADQVRSREETTGDWLRERTWWPA